MYIGEETTAVTREQEDLMLEAARLHHVPDWELLMEASITPALVIGGERRLHRGSRTATTPASQAA
jgi:hypothetical protein